MSLRGLIEFLVVGKVLVLFSDKFLGLAVDKVLLLFFAHAALHSAYYLLCLLLVRDLLVYFVIESLHYTLVLALSLFGCLSFNLRSNLHLLIVAVFILIKVAELLSEFR